MNKIFIFLFVFCMSFHTAFSIQCYVCNTSDTVSPFQCGEWFERYDDPDIQPQDCSNVHGAKYCIKHIGRYEGGIGAKRFCSSKDLGNYCDYVQNKGDVMEYRSCIFTCDTDGCNGATGLSVNKSLGLMLFVVIFIRIVSKFI
ncbi:U-scoloptoxin(05)-Sm1a [Episyrphus balteatus]|uniref:U-scoloptoxin(05)-Sm1a n=1 Tax=Episyrphus balteatus TaxID=286459 RepID=UPI002484DA21|nr:U-scoloptoxin(05)-Sm1a [Episyrphus balteatus]